MDVSTARRVEHLLDMLRYRVGQLCDAVRDRQTDRRSDSQRVTRETVDVSAVGGPCVMHYSLTNPYAVAIIHQTRPSAAASCIFEPGTRITELTELF